jgi:putative glutamine amidotransferase
MSEMPTQSLDKLWQNPENFNRNEMYDEECEMVWVGVTTGTVKTASKETYVGLHQGYIAGITSVGGTPLMIPPFTPTGMSAEQLANQYLDQFDVLLLTGGGDIDPIWYKQDPTTDRLYDIIQSRDALEIALVRTAISRGSRILGICRGMQILNVALGGTLIQDLPEANYSNHSRLDLATQHVHDLTIEANSLLAKLMPTTTQVNTIHHQGVASLAPGLVAAATSPDGVIEAVEGTGNLAGQVLAVQWHPERLLDLNPESFALFDWLVNAMPA